MQRFFVTPDQVGEDKIRIQGSDVNHMKNVLRMRPGEEVMVSDGNNRQYRSAEKSQQKSQPHCFPFRNSLKRESSRCRSVSSSAG